MYVNEVNLINIKLKKSTFILCRYGKVNVKEPMVSLNKKIKHSFPCINVCQARV